MVREAYPCLGAHMDIDPIAATSAITPEHSATDGAPHHEPRPDFSRSHRPDKSAVPPEKPVADDGSHVNRMA